MLVPLILSEVWDLLVDACSYDYEFIFFWEFEDWVPDWFTGLFTFDLFVPTDTWDARDSASIKQFGFLSLSVIMSSIYYR